MPRDTLLDFFDDRVQSSSVFLIYDSGFGSRSFTYDDVRRTALAFAGSLRAAGIGQADKVLFWGENRPEWVMAFWGCVLEGVVVVPLDYRASTDLFGRVMRIVKARGVIVGEKLGCPRWTTRSGSGGWRNSWNRAPLPGNSGRAMQAPGRSRSLPSRGAA